MPSSITEDNSGVVRKIKNAAGIHQGANLSVQRTVGGNMPGHVVFTGKDGQQYGSYAMRQGESE
jgi:hypothetical protein